MIEGIPMKQVVNDRYGLYNGDCCEVVSKVPDASIGISIYSPPFFDLFTYSSSDKDMANSLSYEQFLEHYGFLVREEKRYMMPGRIVAVHCMDLKDRDFPGDIIRIHQANGFVYHGRHCIWKEPLLLAMRTRVLGLSHKQIVKDSTLCHVSSPDYILTFRRRGKNPVPVAHPLGLHEYAGERDIPYHLASKYKDWKNPKTNKKSHWIWQQYASAFWDDIRLGRVLKYKEAREREDERHACPLQLDTIERCLTLWSNPGDIVLEPFMGVGSVPYVAVKMGRKAFGVELKTSYWKQAVKNLRELEHVPANTKEAGFE
jgi:DNA methylase